MNDYIKKSFLKIFVLINITNIDYIVKNIK